MKHEIIQNAINKGQKSLSEYESKKLLADYGIPTTREELARSCEEAMAAAERIGYPVALKACSPELTHKTELGLVALNLETEARVREAYERIIAGARMELDGILVQEMVRGERELVAGLVRDSAFGPCVMFGLGGIYTEVIEDVSFRIAPLEKRDAMEMIEETKAHKIIGSLRGKEAVDRNILCHILMGIGQIGLDFDCIKEIDVNPLIVAGSKPVAVDALIIIDSG